jgi:hypothetical protein
MEEKSNSIIRCLSKTLNSEIKFITIVSIKYIYSDNEMNKKIHVTGEVINNDKILCLSEEKVFILDEQMRKLEETFKYEAISHIKKEAKPECFLLFLKPGSKLKNPSISKFLFTTKSRGNLLKNFMCYYSIYFMYKYASVKSLIIKSEEVNLKLENNNNNLVASNFNKLKQRTLNTYHFFIKGNILKEYNNHYFNIKYDQSLLTGKETERDLAVYSKVCEVNIEIAEPVHLSYLDIERDFRDFSFYANKMFIIYLKNTLKANRWWIITNKIYQKKSNLTQDSCQWEGWKIEARITDPFNINIITIFLRRNFLPPFYDSYQTIQITLTENFTRDFYTLNPCAYRLIELIGNSIHSSQQYSIRTYNLFLRAKVDSLLVDEETLLYLMTCHQIIGDDVHKFGYELMQSIFRYIETTQLKEKIDIHKVCVENKIKMFQENFEVER